MSHDDRPFGQNALSRDLLREDAEIIGQEATDEKTMSEQPALKLDD